MAKKTFFDFAQPVAERETKLLSERSRFSLSHGGQTEVTDVCLQTVTGSTTAEAASLYFDGLHQFDWRLPVGQLGVTFGLYVTVDA